MKQLFLDGDEEILRVCGLAEAPAFEDMFKVLKLRRCSREFSVVASVRTSFLKIDH